MEAIEVEKSIEYDVSSSRGVIDERIQVHSRCNNPACATLLGKIFFTISAPNYNFSISEIFPEIEVKIETEVKCRKCKSISYKVFVV